MKTPVLTFAILGAVLWSVPAAARQFSFDVPSKLVNISFESEMEIEDILGTTHAVSGELDFDSGNKSRFRLAVPVKSLRTGIEMRDEHIQSEMWLDAQRFPDITFEGTSIRKKDDRHYEVSGRFTMHGKSRPLTITVKVREIDGPKAKRLGLARTADKTWMRVRGTFHVKLSDHGVAIPGMAAAKVNNDWTVKFSLFAVEKKQ